MKLWEAMDEVTPRIWEETQRSTSPSIQFQTAPQISNCSKLCRLLLKTQNTKKNESRHLLGLERSGLFAGPYTEMMNIEYYWQILSHWFDIHYLHSSWLESFQLQLLLHLDSCWNEWHLKSESLVKLLYPPFLSVKQAAGSDSGTARYFTQYWGQLCPFLYCNTN